MKTKKEKCEYAVVLATLKELNAINDAVQVFGGVLLVLLTLLILLVLLTLLTFGR